VKAGLGLAVVGGSAWFGLSAYDQPRERAEGQALVTEFLEDALAGDTARLAARAGTRQPVERALELAWEDSFAVRAWTSHGGAVFLTRSGDTLWIALARDPESPRCDNYSALVATALDPPDGEGDPRIIRLAVACLDAAASSGQ
jgi:hypothetical protein